MTDNLQSCRKSVSLHCVFHSIRFKVNKGWSKALLLFFMSIRYLRIQSAFSIAFFINGSMISYPSLFGCTPSFVY
jgi:hypothetical protein